jgi:hypothetical protein
VREIHLDLGPHVAPGDADPPWSRIERGAHRLFNQGYRLPSGDQLRLRLTWGELEANPHARIAVRDVDSSEVPGTPMWSAQGDERYFGRRVAELLGLREDAGGDRLTAGQLALLDGSPSSLASLHHGATSSEPNRR